MSSSVPGFFTCGAVALNVMYRGTGCVCVCMCVCGGGGGGGGGGETRARVKKYTFPLHIATSYTIHT